MIKKQVFILLVALLAIGRSAFAYDFSYTYQGQTLYYNIVDGEAQVTYQRTSSPRYTNLMGDMIIPSSVTYNGTIYSVTSIGYNAFVNCSGLTSVVIPNSISEIDFGAFQNCSGLTSITIPNSVTSIGNATFYNCSGLVSVAIGSSVTSIGISAFQNCSGLTSIFVANDNTKYDSRNNCNAIIETSTNTLIIGCQSTVIPNSVTSIGSSAFFSCSGLTSITIPNSVTSIGSSAFCSCSGLTSITIPNSVTSIGGYAFLYCRKLTSINIPNSVTSIGDSAFWGCIGLTSVTIPNSVTTIGDDAFYYVRHIEYHGNATGAPWGALFMNGLTEGDFVYSDATKHYLVSYIGAGGGVTIPSTVDTIGNLAFCSCSGLTSITIPNSVTAIGSATFALCSGLTTVTIGINVSTIGDEAFYGCSGLDTVFLMPLEPPSFGSEAFDDNALGRVFVLIGCSYDNYYNNSSWSYYRNSLREQVINITLGLSVNEPIFGATNIIPGPRNRNIRCDSTAVIMATANNDYHFGYWSTGSTANPDTLHLVGDSTVTAYFITLDVMTSDSIRGTTTHNKVGNRQEEVFATANYGYHFDHWSNGSTANPDTLQLRGDSTLTAYFERNMYYLTANVNDASLGSVANDSALYLDTLTVVAFPAAHYHVISWSGATRVSANKDTAWVIMDEDHTITCTFAIDTHTVNAVPNDPVRGMVTQSRTEFAYLTPCTVEAIPYSGYTFAGWSDGSTFNPYTFAVLEDVELTAIFLAPGEESYTVTVNVNDPTMGSATINGSNAVTVMSGDAVTLMATANDGYRFVRWNDNDTHAVRTVTVTADMTYTAYFENTTQSITYISASDIVVYASGNRIVVRGAEGMEVRVYDMMGRKVKGEMRKGKGEIVFGVPASGVYLVKVGDTPARRVVVIR